MNASVPVLVSKGTFTNTPKFGKCVCLQLYWLFAMAWICNFSWQFRALCSIMFFWPIPNCLALLAYLIVYALPALMLKCLVSYFHAMCCFDSLVQWWAAAFFTMKKICTYRTLSRKQFCWRSVEYHFLLSRYKFPDCSYLHDVSEITAHSRQLCRFHLSM